MPPVPSFEIASKTFGGNDQTEKTSLDWEPGLRSPALVATKRQGERKKKLDISLSFSPPLLTYTHTYTQLERFHLPSVPVINLTFLAGVNLFQVFEL